MPKTPYPRPDLVIFDCDGVLVDSEPITSEIIADELARHGLPIGVDRVESLFVGGTIAGLCQQARSMGADLPVDWVNHVYGRIYSRLRQGVPIIKGVSAVLDQLDDLNIPYCVGSNGSDEKMQITLGQTGLLERLNDRLFSAQTLGMPKPDPALYLHAAAQFGVAPAACVVVDDSATGCTAGVRAGMRTIGFTEATSPARLTAVGAEIIGSMAELPAKLGLNTTSPF